MFRATTLLLAAALLPLALAEESAPDLPLPAPAAPASESAEAPPAPLPAALADWGQLLFGQTEPGRYLAIFKENGLAVDESRNEFEEECPEARELVQSALAAAGPLYEVRMELLHALLNEPRPGWMKQEAAEFPAEYGTAITEMFWRDLHGLAHCTSWLKESALPLPTRPGRQLMRHLPAPLELLHRNSRGSTAEEGLLEGSISDEWAAQQARFLHAYRDSFRAGENPECPAFDQERSPFTNEVRSFHFVRDEDDSFAEELRRYDAHVVALFDAEEAAWKRYSEAMQALACPSRSYYGSGEGITQARILRHLTDTRMRWCCLLAEGNKGCFPADATVAESDLLPLHPLHGFGEVFDSSDWVDEAVIFRHPALAEQPWCIRFPNADAGFIPLKDNAALQAYAAAEPAGGKARIRGYQMLEACGAPSADGAEYSENPYTLRQIFVLFDAARAGEQAGQTEP